MFGDDDECDCDMAPVSALHWIPWGQHGRVCAECAQLRGPCAEAMRLWRIGVAGARVEAASDRLFYWVSVTLVLLGGTFAGIRIGVDYVARRTPEPTPARAGRLY